MTKEYEIHVVEGQSDITIIVIITKDCKCTNITVYNPLYSIYFKTVLQVKKRKEKENHPSRVT